MKRMSWLMIATVAFTCACGTSPGPSGDPDGGVHTDGNVPMMDAVVPPDDSVPPVDSGPPGCVSATDCDDGVNCTVDSCVTTSGTCRHVVTPALCGSGESCNPATGCETGHACATDADCADTDACTSNERCDPAARVCTFQPLDGDYDGDPPRVCGGTDCDDSKSFVHAGASELCNSIDDDCDGVIDEGADAACGDRHVCDTGACVCQAAYTTCPTGTPLPACIDLTTDAQHCGSCSQSCGPDGTCSAGTCTCPPGQAFCDGRCTNTSNDAANCGSCGHTCAYGLEGCVGGSCVSPCGDTRQPCCYYAACNTDACSDGVCGGCDLPFSFCGGLCKDTRSDAANCGTCGHTCSGATPNCVLGTCVCPAGGTSCGSSCVDMLTNAANCGTCGHGCGTGGYCVDGACIMCGTENAQCCLTGPSCTTGNVCIGWSSFPSENICHRAAPCNALTQTGCLSGEACYAAYGSGTTYCALSGTGVYWDRCFSDTDCTAGFGCNPMYDRCLPN